MKNTIFKLAIILIFSLLFLALKSFGQVVTYDSLVCLELTGKITNIKSKSADNYKVELIYYNTVIDKKTVGASNEFKYDLKKDAIYTLRISKQGYITKLISIYTKVPEKNNEFYRLDFETDLIEEHKSKNLNQDALDFPITIIYYDNKANWFYFNEEYTSNIKKSIYNSKVVRNKI